MFPSLNPEDLGLLILVATIAAWAITHKILNNRRQVIRNVLHGQVTYTIKGYSGLEAQRITRALAHDDSPPNTDPFPVQILPKATSKDVRK
jgi:hypothetical protein